MKREKVIELHEKAKREARLGEFIEYFARLVEQETLERAAKKCEEIAYMMGGSVGAMDCALSIRNLKDNHDKE